MRGRVGGVAFLVAVVAAVAAVVGNPAAARPPTPYVPVPPIVFREVRVADDGTAAAVGPTLPPAPRLEPSRAPRVTPVSPSALAPRSAPATAPVLLGRATYYCCTAGFGDGAYAAAGPALRVALGPNWRGRYVTVRSAFGFVRVRLVDWCACGGGHTIDLEPGAFRLIGPFSRGVIPVTITW